MALFGKKKEEKTEPLSFGFPATERRRQTDFEMPDMLSEAEYSSEPAPQPRPFEAKPMEIRDAPIQRSLPPMPQRELPEPALMRPAPAEPALFSRPVSPMTMPEEIQEPSAPAIQRLRPHVFLKISKYKEVMTSIDKITNHIRDLKKSLKNIRDAEEKEVAKVKENDEVLLKLEEIAGVLDRIFSNPEK
ncbi:MAG: hypothetical protein WC307_03730 [Candidatus Nanoarchaeia archaeon]|jgi:hypothetical protein